jgi:hypothetical protein
MGEKAVKDKVVFENSPEWTEKCEKPQHSKSLDQE